MAIPRGYETVHVELLTLTYGAIASQIVRDYEDPREVNAQLEQLGYSMGTRLVDDFCARQRGAGSCSYSTRAQLHQSDVEFLFFLFG